MRIGLMLAFFLAWIGLAEIVNGTPSSIVGYYLIDYNLSTQGQVVTSHLKYTKNSSKKYKVVYEFSVAGKQYTSTKVNFRANYTDVAELIVAKYPEGNLVTVYYSEFNPSFSVLEKSKPDLWLVMQFFSSFVLVLFAIQFFLPSNKYARKRARRKRD